MTKKGAGKKVAFFDIDGTIFRSSLLIELVETLIDRGIFDEKVRLKIDKPKKSWLDRQGNYDNYINAVIEVFLDNLKGVHYTEFDEVAKLVIDRNKDKTYRFTRDLIKQLKKEKYFLVAISQSPKKILDLFCKRLGFDKVYGRIYELGPSYRFTGQIVDEHIIANKANIVKRVVEKEGLDLKGSIGVGDTEGDFSLLEMVDKPICFNPNQKLLRQAKRNGWRVVVERKDVIYEIKV
jgi:HAD superfamily hydrolase (TIGR01490 family)